MEYLRKKYGGVVYIVAKEIVEEYKYNINWKEIEKDLDNSSYFSIQSIEEGNKLYNKLEYYSDTLDYIIKEKEYNNILSLKDLYNEAYKIMALEAIEEIIDLED